MTWIHSDGFNESGAGPLNLRVDGGSETFWTARPAIELGNEFELKGDQLLRLYGKLGVTHFFSGTSPSIQARLEGAPSNVSAFTVRGDIDDNIGDLEVGVSLLRHNDMVLRVGYQGLFSSDYRAHGGFARFSMPF